LEAHAFQRHVGGLAIGVGARISICREQVFPVAAVGLECNGGPTSCHQ
jgi:hypothetical protein